MEPRRVSMLGAPLDLLTMEQTVTRCMELIESGQPAQHVVVNAGKYVLMADDDVLREIVSRCAVVNADGMSVVWAGRLLGYPVPERVAGIDLMAELLALCSLQRWPVYFLGAKAEVLDRFVEVVKSRHPDLEVAGAADGYFADEDAVADAVRTSGARVLFIGMPSPQKELFADRQLSRLGPVLAVGVGGSFDVWAGVTSRAPVWMQKAGLEWLYRFAQEPRRMWKRYLVGNTRFLWLVARARFGPRP